MNEPEKITMNLNIGGCAIALTVAYKQQEFVRDVESKVNDLYTRWRHDFPKKTDREVLAMVAYQFASHYSELTDRYVAATEKARRCLDIIDSLDDHENDHPAEAII